jgi:hypothetical protein
MPKFNVIQYMYLEREYETETPEEALELFEAEDIDGCVTLGGTPVDWSVSDALGIEVQDEDCESLIQKW